MPKVDFLKVTKEYWNNVAKQYQDCHLEHLDKTMHPSWGLWHIPEKRINIFENYSLVDKLLVDLGCGQGQDAFGYAEMGANVIGVDIAANQIAMAIRHKKIKYIIASGHKLPLKNNSIDVVVCDHGAFDHAPAKLLLKEMSRIIKPSGMLVICTYSPLSFVCYDETVGKVTTNLINKYPYSESKYDGSSISFQYSYSNWIRMFLENNFVIRRLEELLIPDSANDYFDELVDINWASRWPCDVIWVLLKE
jgi:ubiquinone/menaquinone biosynthesis C-methylase UbiE